MVPRNSRFPVKVERACMSKDIYTAVGRYVTPRRCGTTAVPRKKHC